MRASGPGAEEERHRLPERRHSRAAGGRIRQSRHALGRAGRGGVERALHLLPYTPPFALLGESLGAFLLRMEGGHAAQSCRHDGDMGRIRTPRAAGGRRSGPVQGHAYRMLTVVLWAGGEWSVNTTNHNECPSLK